MVASRCCIVERCAALCVGLALASEGRAETSLRAQLTLRKTSDELLGHGPKLPVPSWDKLATARSEGDSYGLFALQLAEPSYLPGLTTSAALRLELGISNAESALQVVPRDASSFVGLTGWLNRSTSLGLRAFPLDTNYQRLGYLHALDWGGTRADEQDSVFRGNVGGAPGVELRLQSASFQAFSGVKWGETSTKNRVWGALAGGQVELRRWLRAEAGFGYFQTGANAALPGFVAGATFRLVCHAGVDEPELRAEPLRAPMFRTELEAWDDEAHPGAALALEGVGLIERPIAFASFSSPPLRTAPAAGAYGSLRSRAAAAHVALLWRSLNFVLRSDPRPPAPEALPPSTALLDELSAWLGGSVLVASEWLWLGTELGLQLPAAFVTPSAIPGVPRTLLVGGRSGLSGLPLGAARLPTFSARLSLRARFSAHLALGAFVDYRRDPNRTSPQASAGGGGTAFAPPDGLWWGGAAQARF
jgi:hypothetical protein